VIVAPIGEITNLDRFLAIRDRFAGGGSTLNFLLAVVGIIAAVAVLRLMHLFVLRLRLRELNHPGKLFREVLVQLPLGVRQRDLLRRMARDMRLEHPVHLVLSPQLFQQLGNRWMVTTRRATPEVRRELNALAAALFAHGEDGSRGQ
jgi:hypothetical protein